MSTVNPYETPLHALPTRKPSSSTGLKWLRIAMYIHLVAIVGCALLTLTDTGLLKIGTLAHEVLWAASSPLVFSWMICPSFTIAAAWTTENRSTAFRISVTIFACLMSVFQLWVCLPLVQ